MVYALVLLCSLHSTHCDENNAEVKINAEVSKNMCITGIGRFKSPSQSYSTRIICKKD